MFKLFFKSFLEIFLWIILLVNLLYFTNYIANNSIGGVANVDYSTKYFGVSSLIDSFKLLTHNQLKWLDSVEAFKNKLMNIGSQLLVNNFYTIEINPSGNDVLDFFTRVGNFLAGIFSSLTSIFIYVFAGGLSALLFTFTFLNFAALILKFFNGSIYKDIPTPFFESDSDTLITLFSNIRYILPL